MPCWARCLLGFWYIWGIGPFVTYLLALAITTAPYALIVAAAVFAFLFILLLIQCIRRCGNRA